MLIKEAGNIKQQLDCYIDGQLSTEEIEDLWSHIIQEEEYFDYLNVAANIKALDAPVRSAPVYYLMKLVAAAVLVLVVVFGVIKISSDNLTTPVQAIAVIELPFQRSAVAPVNLSRHDQIIREAVLLYYNGELEKSVNILKNELAIANDIGWKSQLNINLGIFYYNSNKYELAESSFQFVISAGENIKPLLLEKAYWYLGNTLYQLNDVSGAKEMMRNVVKIDGAYSRLAQKKLN